MEARELNEKLLANFPELNDKLKTYMEEEDGFDTGAFLTYEDVFRKHIETSLRINDIAFLERAGKFLEELMETGDGYACNVVTVGVLEGLKANCNINHIRSLLRPKCRSVFDEIDL